jgi:hypothetical protein
MNVKVFRMSSGEDVVAEVLEDNDLSIVVMNAIVAFNQGDGQLGFAPYAPLLKRTEKELEIDKNWIVYIANVNDELVEKYEEMFSPIKTPSSKLIL